MLGFLYWTYTLAQESIRYPIPGYTAYSCSSSSLTALGHDQTAISSWIGGIQESKKTSLALV